MRHIAIAKNTLYQVLARLVSSGTNFLIVVMIIHQFSLQYGDFAKVTAYVSLFYLITDFGFNAIFLQRDDNRVRFRDLLYPRLLLAALLAIGVNIIATVLPYNEILNTGYSPAVRMGITIFSFTLLTESVIYTCLAVFQRELKYELFLFCEIVASIILLSTIGLLILSRAPLMTLLYAYVLAGVVQSITAVFLTKEELLPIRFDTRFFLTLARETLPIGLMLFFNLVYFRIDMFLLAIFKPTQDVAIYDFAYKFFDFLIALPLFLSNALYPSLIENQKNNRITVQMVRKYALLFFTLSIPLVIIVWFISPVIQIIKPEYIASAFALRILAISLPVFFATSILQWVLIAQKKQKELLSVYFFATLLNVALNFYFIPLYSYTASAIITGVSEAIVGIILALLVFLNPKNKQ